VMPTQVGPIGSVAANVSTSMMPARSSARSRKCSPVAISPRPKNNRASARASATPREKLWPHSARGRRRSTRAVKSESAALNDRAIMPPHARWIGGTCKYASYATTTTHQPANRRMASVRDSPAETGRRGNWLDTGATARSRSAPPCRPSGSWQPPRGRAHPDRVPRSEAPSPSRARSPPPPAAPPDPRPSPRP